MRKTKENIVFFHYMPLEGYPPIQNLLKSERLLKANTFCITTNGRHNFIYHTDFAKVFRFGNSDVKGRFKALALYLSYLQFNLLGFIFLLLKRPKKVLYYESISAFPALAYHWLFPNTDLFVLYHEYTAKEEYSSGPFLVRFFHKLERRRYHKIHWISHTNNDRRLLFSKDYNIAIEKIEILPNYPPKSWFTKLAEKKGDSGLKLVYVGYTLDNASMYVDEILKILNDHSNLTLDFYLFKIPKNLVNDLKSKTISSRIKWNNGLAYDQLPDILSNYDVGLILYRGSTKNFIFNAPNKLFEYLACGLNVWYPNVMIGVKKYRSSRVIEVDYNNLENFKPQFEAKNRMDDIDYKDFNSDTATEQLLNKLLS